MKATWSKVLIAALLMAILTTSMAEAAPPPPQGTVYIVRWGDTLYSIARRFGTTVGALAALNGIAPPYTIKVGQVLIVTP